MKTVMTMKMKGRKETRIGEKKDQKGKRRQVSSPGHYIRKEACLLTAGVMLH